MDPLVSPPTGPRRFASVAAFRTWLERHHADTAELVLCCYKVHAAHRGLTYREALDEALCFGWIDGVRRSLDADSFSVRFSPRRARSVWSAVNIRRATELEAEGRMRAAGLSAFRARGSAPAPYSFESKPLALSPAFNRRLKANREAWAFFQAQPPWYRRTSSFWVMSARRPETRERRFGVLLDHCSRSRAIPPLTSPGKRS